MRYVVVGRRPSEAAPRILRACSSLGDAQLNEQGFRDRGYVECRVERASASHRLRPRARDMRRR